MNTPCELDGFCPYSNDPTPHTCDMYCDYESYAGYEYYEGYEDENDEILQS